MKLLEMQSDGGISLTHSQNSKISRRQKMSAGRPRKPRHLKVIRGTARKDRDRPDHSRQGSPPSPPSYLSAPARRLFCQYVSWCPWLVEADARPLAIFVDLLIAAEEGAAGLKASQLSQLRGLASDLGFTAATKAAARQHADAPPPPEEPLTPEEIERRRIQEEYFDN